MKWKNSVHDMMKQEEMSSWERYIARNFELRLERDTELKNIKMCWLWYFEQTVLLESLETRMPRKG